MNESEFIKMIVDEYNFEKADVIEALVRLKDNQGHVAQAAMLANFAEMPLSLGVDDLIRAYNL